MDHDELQKQGIAYHEAGHAMVALRLRGRVIKTQIERGSEWSGKTHAELPKDDAVKAAYLAAGAIAQERGIPDSLSLFTDQHDINELNALADRQVSNPHLIGPFASPEDQKKRQAFLKQAKATAEGILGLNWGRVERLANALLESHQLVEEQVAQFVNLSNEEQ